MILTVDEQQRFQHGVEDQGLLNDEGEAIDLFTKTNRCTVQVDSSIRCEGKYQSLASVYSSFSIRRSCVGRARLTLLGERTWRSDEFARSLALFSK